MQYCVLAILVISAVEYSRFRCNCNEVKYMVSGRRIASRNFRPEEDAGAPRTGPWARWLVGGRGGGA